MKKIFVLLILMATLVLTSCGNKKAAIKKNIVDWQGYDFGSGLSEWVVDYLANPNDSEKLKKDLALEDKKIFVISQSGDDLGFLKEWTDQSDVFSIISERLIESSAVMINTIMAKEPELAQKVYAETIMALNNFSLSGVECNLNYWIQTKDSSYMYFKVYTIETNLMKKQIERILDNVSSLNTNETTKTLRMALIAMLSN